MRPHRGGVRGCLSILMLMIILETGFLKTFRVLQQGKATVCVILQFYIVYFFLLGKTYLVQTTTCTDCPVNGSILHSPGVVQSPVITILLRYFDMGFFFCVYILAAVLVVEYTLMDHLYFCIYLFITRPQPQPSPPPLSACRMYCM